VLFKGATTIDNGETKMTASLGTLFTFSLSDAISIAADAPMIEPQTAVGNASFAQTLTNNGREPVVITGVAVVLDSRGTIVAKSAFDPRRALPGERLGMKTDVSSDLAAGDYRVLLTFAFGGKTLTTTAGMRVE
jgi:hypothetical protein